MWNMDVKEVNHIDLKGDIVNKLSLTKEVDGRRKTRIPIPQFGFCIQIEFKHVVFHFIQRYQINIFENDFHSRRLLCTFCRLLCVFIGVVSCKVLI